MTIAKPSKDLSSPQSQKKRFPYWIRDLANIIPTLLFASLFGTYLDLYFVGKGLYSFSIRPFPDIFSINIAFTLIILPLFIGFFLLVCHKVTIWHKLGLIFILSLLMSVVEKQAEALGFFIHHDSWKHIYSFFGYSLYLLIVYSFYHWTKGYKT